VAVHKGKGGLTTVLFGPDVPGHMVSSIAQFQNSEDIAWVNWIHATASGQDAAAELAIGPVIAAAPFETVTTQEMSSCTWLRNNSLLCTSSMESAATADNEPHIIQAIIPPICRFLILIPF
jgi:hypothetical protein